MIYNKRIKSLIIRSLFVVLIYLLLLPQMSNALELYTIVEKNKILNSGLIIDVEENKATLLLLDGTLKGVLLNDISAILIYNIIENPLYGLQINPELSKFLRKVYIEDVDEPSLTALPVQLINEMVIFYDISGKIHVHRLSNIYKLRSYKYREDKYISFNNAPINLNIGDILLDGNIDTEFKGEEIYPTKTLSDTIKIYDFFSTLRDGFLKINNYKERTYVYAKPFLFDQSLKLGNVFLFWGNKLIGRDLFNTYFQWSTGTSHGFQTQTTIGGALCEWLPRLSPLWALQSEIKSHFFNSTFVGNINPKALPAGSRYYTSEDDFDDMNFGMMNDEDNAFDKADNIFGSDVEEKLIVDDDPYITSHINYLLSIGVDYKCYSLSVGMFNPIYAIRVNNHFREIMASKNSPFFKFIYFKGDIRLKSMFSVSRYHHKDDDVIDNVYARYLEKKIYEYVETEYGWIFPFPMLRKDIYGYAEYNSDSESPLLSYRFKSYFARFGISYDLNPDIQLGLDGVVIAGKYTETFNAIDFSSDISEIILQSESITYDLYSNTINFKQYNTGIYIYQNFSDYVAIKLILNIYISQYKYNMFNISDNDTSIKLQSGGSFELIF
ncbi:MAG: hypothetical protein SVZ03_08235 [Spirochaetota bacterium]|nr:hypothetical protein [Spirochaetota bacterium]